MKERVYERLKVELLQVDAPGIFLQEKQLAHTFGVSKTPIREALADLVKDRFVQLIPRKGYWVAPIDCRKLWTYRIAHRAGMRRSRARCQAHHVRRNLKAWRKLTLSLPPTGRTARAGPGRALRSL